MAWSRGLASHDQPVKMVCTIVAGRQEVQLAERRGCMCSCFSALLTVAGLLLIAVPTTALDNGLARTPQMGFNTWNFFRCDINETVVREVADAMVESGLRDAGYKYVVIDDCWQEKRGPDGGIQPFKSKFPSGMKALAAYVHSKGMLFGLYSDTGNKTCEGYPGSWGYEKLDAKTYAEWGVDYLKYDYCGMDQAHEPVETSYARMRDALLASGRPILYSLCSWGAGEPWKWGHKVGNSWRTGIDVFAVWDDATATELKLPNFLQPIMRAVGVVEPLHHYAGPGGFNDPDMLVVGLEGMYPYGIVKECPPHIVGCRPGDYISKERWGRVGGLTVTEQRTHFAFWCMLASPLILGNDPRHMTRTTLDILTAPQLIAINQDPLTKQAVKVWSSGDHSIWIKPLDGGKIAAMLFNAGKTAADITLKYARDMSEDAATWARDLPDVEPVCVDKLSGCAAWAKSGECERNPAYMLEWCKASCPAACPRPLGPPGPKATAMVMDAWQQEDLGPHVAIYRAHLVEPHEARVLILRFVEPSEAAAWQPTLPRITTLTAGDQQQQPRAQVARKAAETVANTPTQLQRLQGEVAFLRKTADQFESERDHLQAQLRGLKERGLMKSSSTSGSPAWLLYLLVSGNLMLLFLLVTVSMRRKGSTRRRFGQHST